MDLSIKVGDSEFKVKTDAQPSQEEILSIEKQVEQFYQAAEKAGQSSAGGGHAASGGAQPAGHESQPAQGPPSRQAK